MKIFKTIAISAVILVIVLILIPGSPKSETTKQSTPRVVDEVAKQAPAKIESMDIGVESQIIKKVGKKYRYFFNISNKDTKDFAGKLHIVGKTGSGTRVISKYIDYTDKSLKAGLSQSVYAEASSAPGSMIGEYGVSTFTFSATMGKDEVSKGEGLIIDKFEDLSN